MTHDVEEATSRDATRTRLFTKREYAVAVVTLGVAAALAVDTVFSEKEREESMIDRSLKSAVVTVAATATLATLADEPNGKDLRLTADAGGNLFVNGEAQYEGTIAPGIEVRDFTYDPDTMEMAFCLTHADGKWVRYDDSEDVEVDAAWVVRDSSPACEM